MPRTLADFEIVRTADGSPSLRISDPTGYVEKMHHSDGAWSESLYIYHSALVETLERGWPLHVLSLGLGLGYNEILTVTEAIRRGIAPNSARLYSFETEDVLSEAFLNWAQGQPSAYFDLYQDVASRAETALGVGCESIRAWLSEAFKTQSWTMRKSFPDETEGVNSISCVLYDAFSNKMNPELWNDTVITQTLSQLCSPNCVFATYAATGSLNRALKVSGFEKQPRRGFSGKRESTFAIRKALA